MYALNLDKETNRILSATSEKYAADGMPIVPELPQGDITEYICKAETKTETFVAEDGTEYTVDTPVYSFVHSPLPKPEPKPKIPTLEERNRADIDFLMLMGGYDV